MSLRNSLPARLKYLVPFCGTAADKPWLFEPFSRGDWTYATDSAVVVRIPREREVPSRPTVAPLIETLFFPGQGESRGALEMPLLGPRLMIPCPECVGFDGRVSRGCPDCRGAGKVEKAVGVELDGRTASSIYIRRIRAFLFNVVPVHTKGGPEDPLGFVFAGGTALLKPMRYVDP